MDLFPRKGSIASETAVDSGGIPISLFDAFGEFPIKGFDEFLSIITKGGFLLH